MESSATFFSLFSMRTLFLPFVTLSLIAMGVSLSSCAVSPQQNALPNQLSVTASFYPIAFIAERVGGENVHVTQITPRASEPHDYEPTPHDVVSIERGDIFLWNGYGVDAWAQKTAENLSRAGKTSLQVAEGLATLSFNHKDDDHDHVDEHNHTIDPHVWLDPTLMQTMTERVRDAFIQRDPAHADAYRASAEDLRQQLENVHQEYVTGLSSCAQKHIVTSHDAFGYMAHRYGLIVTSIAGISSEEEPSPARMAEIISVIHREKVSTVFFEALISPRLSEIIAQETGATTSMLNPIEGLTDNNSAEKADYLSLMRSNLASLRTALSCK
jgi:zinc transport system substrate-binding protein